MIQKVVLFADGASSGNPGPGGWGTVVLFLEANGSGQIVELGGGEPQTTNNRMELVGVIRGLELIRNHAVAVEVCTDSTYVIRGITQWVWGWRKNGWKTAEGKDVAHVDLWQTLQALVSKLKVEWKFVRGHSGIPGNERVDQIAVEFSKGRKPFLFEGPFSAYSVDLLKIPADTALPKAQTKATEKAKPTSYLSIVGNAPKRHKTWSECEGRIKGVSGAKFKKAMSTAEEETILKAWGFKIADLKDN